MASLRTSTITAMTSVFTPAPDCSDSWTFEGSYYNSISQGLLIQNLYADDINTACFPPKFSMSGRAPSSIQVYSPGACPSGYTTPGLFNNDGTTTAICCESGYSYATSFSTINFNTGSSVLFMGCLSTFKGTTEVMARAGATELSSTTVTGPLTMWGQPITVEFQEKDLALFASTTSASTSSTTSSSSSTVSATASNTSSPPTTIPSSDSSSSRGTTSSSSLESSGLSTGAKAGIAIAVVLVALLAVGLGVFLIMKRRRRRLTGSKVPDTATSHAEPKWEPGELEGDDLRTFRGQPDTKPLAYSSYADSSVVTSSQGRSGVVSELE